MTRQNMRARCKSMMVVVPLILAALFSAQANAECQAGGCLNVNVTEIYMNTLAAGFHVQTSGNETLANCTPISGILLTVPETFPHFKEIYSLLLSAQLSGKAVTIMINQGSDPCTISYAKLLN